MGAQVFCPIGNGDFAGTGELAELEHGDAALRVACELAQSFVGVKRPGNDFFSRLGVVREPDGRGRAGGCLLTGFVGEDCDVPFAFHENNAAG